MKKGFELNIARVRELALENGMSERQLLTKSGCSTSLLSNARKGCKVLPMTIAKLAGELGCSPSELVKVGDNGAENEDN